MFFILLGIALAVLFFNLKAQRYEDRSFYDLLAKLFLVACIFIGIVAPLSGYEENERTAIVELVNLSDATTSRGGGLFYVSITAGNSYTYYTEVESDFAEGTSKAYKSVTITDEDVTIIEDNSYIDAKLVEYVKKAKATFWTFGVWYEKFMVVFKVAGILNMYLRACNNLRYSPYKQLHIKHQALT